jgi:RimJ/RimL family protein N-acetyltransferase
MNLEIGEKYLCLKNKKYEFENYSLIGIREKDIESIRKWRNNQMGILRQKEKISKKEQIQYYKSIIEKNFKKKYPDSILFSYMLNGKCIGYGGLTNIDWNSKRAELSFLVNDRRYLDSKMYTIDFFSFLNIITRLAFLELKFNRLFTETYHIRSKHLQILKKVGFQFEGKLKQHTMINGKYVDSIIHGYLQNQYIKKNNVKKTK